MHASMNEDGGGSSNRVGRTRRWRGHVDRIGNILARRTGRDPRLPPVMTGSHLDTEPTGGKFDGSYGVMAGLEVVRTLNDLGYDTEAPVEIVAWTNEEGSRFSPAMVGSGSSPVSSIWPRVWHGPTI